PPHSGVKLLFAAFLCVGLVASFTPQYVKLVRARSSQGINPLYLLLGIMSNFCVVANLALLQRPVMACCWHVWTFRVCLENMGSFVQVFLQWFLFAVLFALYYVYWQPSRRGLLTLDWRQRQHYAEWRSARSILTAAAGLHVAIAALVVLLAVTDGPLGARGPLGGAALVLAGLFGTVAALLCVAQFLPQLYSTWVTRDVGALSLLMMLMQTPGGYLMMLSIALQPGNNWTSWAPYFLAASMQGALLLLCL
ncbi:hypothetical protein CXG81DRAFT_2254, partial [Caulochytrium protostelioides]